MKLIKLAAAALITLSSLTAQAGYLKIDGGANSAVPANNYYLGNLNPQTYNIGGNLQSDFDGVLSLEFSYLGSEAGWKNKFTSGAGSIDNQLPSPFFGYFDTYAVGDLIPFTFSTNGSPVPNFVANGNNNGGDQWVSFATALTTNFNGVGYDAILFFDDTGGFQDDDNHDDLVIGVRVLKATVVSVPEASTLALMFLGLAGLVGARRRKLN